MRYQLSLTAVVIVILAAVSLAGQAQAGTCQQVTAKGVAKNLATATLYAQADLKQTAKSLRGKVTQSTTNCIQVPSGYRCRISAVVCPK